MSDIVRRDSASLSQIQMQFVKGAKIGKVIGFGCSLFRFLCEADSSGLVDILLMSAVIGLHDGYDSAMKVEASRKRCKIDSRLRDYQQT